MRVPEYGKAITSSRAQKIVRGIFQCADIIPRIRRLYLPKSLAALPDSESHMSASMAAAVWVR